MRDAWRTSSLRLSVLMVSCSDVATVKSVWIMTGSVLISGVRMNASSMIFAAVTRLSWLSRSMICTKQSSEKMSASDAQPETIFCTTARSRLWIDASPVWSFVCASTSRSSVFTSRRRQCFSVYSMNISAIIM